MKEWPLLVLCAFLSFTSFFLFKELLREEGVGDLGLRPGKKPEAFPWNSRRGERTPIPQMEILKPGDTSLPQSSRSLTNRYNRNEQSPYYAPNPDPYASSGDVYRATPVSQPRSKRVTTKRAGNGVQLLRAYPERMVKPKAVQASRVRSKPRFRVIDAQFVLDSTSSSGSLIDVFDPPGQRRAEEGDGVFAAGSFQLKFDDETLSTVWLPLKENSTVRENYLFDRIREHPQLPEFKIDPVKDVKIPDFYSSAVHRGIWKPIYFDTGEVQIPRIEMDRVAELANDLNSIQFPSRVLLAGHSTKTEPLDFESSLSIQRANNLRLKLAEQGVPIDAIVTLSFGDTVETDEEDWKEEGRGRVEVGLYRIRQMDLTTR